MTTISSGYLVTATDPLSDAVVIAGGIVAVLANGIATSNTISNGGTINQQGGTVVGTVISSGGRQVAFSGVVQGTVVSDGGIESVLAGAGAIGSHISSGGSELVSAGGSGSGLAISASGSELLAGTDTGTTVTGSGATQMVTGGGNAISAALIAGGEQIVGSGGTASGTTVSSGGSQVVSSGGRAVSALVSSGGEQTVAAFGSVSGTKVLSGGSALIDTSGAGAGLDIAIGASATDFGTLSGARISGLLSVGAGGLDSGGIDLGTEIVFSGGIASATKVYGTFSVSNGGSAIDTTALGSFDVSSGGSAVGAIVSGTLRVHNGGLAVSTTVEGGLFVVSSGIFEFVPGTVDIAAGGSAVGLTIVDPLAGPPGTVALLGTSTEAAGGAVLGGAISGGLLLADGLVSGVTVLSGSPAMSGILSAGSGATGDAITVSAGGTLKLASGALVSGAVIDGGLLEIASGGLASGTISFAGTGAGGTLKLDANATPGASVVGMQVGQSIDFAGLAFAGGGSAVLSGSVLSVTEGSTTDTLNFSTSGTPRFVLAQDAGSGTLVDIACYAAGTRIATPRGEVPVESLAAGDAVLAWQDGEWRPARVRWVGCSTVDLARHPQPERAAPVRIRAHAIGQGAPARDLWLSPDHAVYLDGALIQAQALLNGATVVQEFPTRIDYVHVELDRHAVLLAEGLPAESYLDTGNRAIFAGEAGVRPLHVDLAGAAAWDERACAPLLLGGARVAAAHARVLERAGALGWTTDADVGLRVIQDGATARLVSRVFVPAWHGLAPDRRRLGIAVAALRLDGRKLPRRAFGAGWHAPEPGLRWTDGDARIALRPVARPALLALRLAVGGRYWRVEQAMNASRPSWRDRAIC